ncbi:Flp family type IVb pilin [Allorhodopirellula solitaria]|uniref:Flp family type IVb pilin n=1 Tax=Allorhodopirellula solitaria TaxID=2527987 RepID=UPI0011B3CEDA|nr:Flp family type IVb pilin [Allorhodopirellula solitaria]
MKKFAEHVMDFLKEEDGPTAVEYAVMIALMGATCLAILRGTDMNTVSDANDLTSQLGG